MNIINYDDLFSSPELNNHQLNLRKIGLNTLELAIESVRPQMLIEQSIKIEGTRLIVQNDVYDLNNFKNIYIIGGGKATAEMANSIARLLNQAPKINYKGIINIQKGLNIDALEFRDKFQINYASHPIPDIIGLNGTKSMIKFIQEATKEDLIICLISGGGSALLPLPRKDITLEDLKDLNSLLLDSGASIYEINTIRKHISDFKGGNLAKTVYTSSNATLISLIISDVIGNTLDSIASGPTVPDPTTFKDAIVILKKYHLFDIIPSRIRDVLKEGLIYPELENPKQDNICFKKIHNYLIGSVEYAAHKVELYLKQHSYRTENFSNSISGEARVFSKELYKYIRKKVKEHRKSSLKERIALIGTGELTVTIKGDGIGGRNQEMLLAYLNLLINKKIDYHFLIVAVNLDGIEGNSLAMGALIDDFIMRQSNFKSIEILKYLNNNNSNSFFKMIGTEIVTGPTGCNVNDIVIALLEV